MGHNLAQRRRQALKDWRYIEKNYGFAQSHDYDDERLWKLLESPDNQTALEILKDLIREIFEYGYYTLDGFSGRLPLTDKKIIEIKDRWNIDNL